MNRSRQELGWSEFRVGVMTFTALFFFLIGVTFAGGDKGLTFGKKSYVRAWLADVGGLKKGSAVTIGGMTIGKVTKITFASAPPYPIEVVMLINSKYRNRIRLDSVPSVRTQGMLGDRYVEISPGGDAAGVLPEDKPLIGKGASDFDAALRQTSAVLSETERLLHAINQREGTMGHIVYDEKLYTNLTEVSATLRDLLKDFKEHPRRYVKLSLF